MTTQIDDPDEKLDGECEDTLIRATKFLKQKKISRYIEEVYVTVELIAALVCVIFIFYAGMRYFR